VRVRYAIALIVASAWCIALATVAEDWGSAVQFAGLALGVLLLGGIAFPDDLRSNRYLAKRDGSPGSSGSRGSSSARS
jgi:uncharacterized membrane protein